MAGARGHTEATGTNSTDTHHTPCLICMKRVDLFIPTIKKKEHTILHHFTCLGEKMKTKISEFIYFVPIISLQDWP